MPLNLTEQRAFTAEQLAHLSRMDPVALDRMLDPPVEEGEPPRTTAEKNALRTKVLDQLKRKTPEQVRMRVNVTSGGNQTVIFSNESDYTADEQEAISTGWKHNQGRKALDEFPAIVGEYNRMLGEGIDKTTALAILRNR